MEEQYSLSLTQRQWEVIRKSFDYIPWEEATEEVAVIVDTVDEAIKILKARKRLRTLITFSAMAADYKD